MIDLVIIIGHSDHISWYIVLFALKSILVLLAGELFCPMTALIELNIYFNSV